MLVCRIFPSALPSLSFFIIKLLINYSLDSKAVKCSSSDFDYMPEKLLASSICPASNRSHCPNLQLAIDVVRESPSGATSPWEHNTGTAGVTETCRLFPQAGRVASAVCDPSVVWVPACVALQLLQHCFIAVCYWNYSCWWNLLPVGFF